MKQLQMYLVERVSLQVIIRVGNLKKNRHCVKMCIRDRSDGGPVAVPSQDMVLGIYYLTQERPGAKGEGKCFKSVNEAILAYENGAVTLHTRVKVKITKKMADGTVKSAIVESTVGRFIFNEIIPQDLGFVDRSIPENELNMEVDFHVGKKQLKQILEKVINVHGATQTAVTLDDIKIGRAHV